MLTREYQIYARPYQLEAIDALWEYFANGGKGNPLVSMPTGTGKSLVPPLWMLRAFQHFPNSRMAMLTHVKELVEQNRKALERVWPTAPVGIYSAGLDRKEAFAPIVFGSIQSANRAIQQIGWRDILFIDEAQLLSPNKSSMYQQSIAELREINPNMKVIGLTATPFRMGQGKLTDPTYDSEGNTREPIFTDIVFDISGLHAFNRLIDEHYLSPLVPKPTSVVIDVSDVRELAGEFVQSDLAEAYKKQNITRRALAESWALASDRKSWIVFGAGIENCESINQAMNEMGIASCCVHSKMKNEQRDSYIEAFKAGRFRAIVSNNILCLDEETEILTDQGFVGIDDMTYDHSVACWTQKETWFAPPSLITRRDRMPGEKMVSSIGRKTNIRVTANHRMVYRTGEHLDFQIEHAENLVDRKIMVPVSGNAEPLPFHGFEEPDREKRRKAINSLAYVYRQKGLLPEEARAKAENHHLRIEKETSPKKPCDLSSMECCFIGFWIGDGTKANGRYSVTQSDVYPFIQQQMKMFADWSGLHYTETKYPKHLTLNFVSGKGGCDQARNGSILPLDPYLQKDGSPLFACLNTSQLENVLCGLWLADGNHGNGRNYKSKLTYVVGTQLKLYECLQSVLVVRGYSCSIKKLQSPEKENRNQQYRFSWRKANQQILSKTKLQFEKEWKPERVWCVTSESGMLITRRHGRVTVVGNTTGFDHPQVDCIVDLRPTTSVVLHVQKYGRGTRPYFHPSFNYEQLRHLENRKLAMQMGGKNNCIVLDFAGNTNRLGPINDPRIPKKKGKGTGEVPVKICPECGAYNHTTARFCCDNQCNYEFIFKTKIKSEASTAEIIRRVEDDVTIEIFDVSTMNGYLHRKDGKTDKVRVQYFSGIQTFNVWLGFEPNEKGFVKHKSREWWRQHSSGECPQSTEEALDRFSECRMTRQLKVNVAKQYPEIMEFLF